MIRSSPRPTRTTTIFPDTTFFRSRGPMTDSFLDATIKDYVRQCYPVARVSPAYGIDDDQLFRTSNDLPAAFAAMAGPATFSTVFTAPDKGGTTVSCTAAWRSEERRGGKE